jgi:hypothetical protein
MTGNFYEGNRRQHRAEDVTVIAHHGDSIAVRSKDGDAILHRPEVTYAAWFQLLATAPGASANILRRTA